VLLIRNDQVGLLQQAVRSSFEREMVLHLTDFSPPLVEAIGEDQLRAVIHLGMVRSAQHEFTHRGPVRLYLELMLLFGSHFDTDPQYPWAAEILADRRSGSQMQRAERLYERTLAYREAVVGPGDSYTLAALRNISLLSQRVLNLSSDNFVSDMLHEIHRVYPQKAAFLGEHPLEALIREGVERARAYRFPTLRGYALMIVLMLAFGHGCAIDPLYPWIGRTLSDEMIKDEGAREKRLEAKALTWLKHVLAAFAEARA
jgi:hypothetical protein